MEGRFGQGLSPHCRGVEGGRLCQREGGSKGADAEALAGPAASGQQGEQEAHCAPRSALPLHTQAVLLGEPRSCLTGSGSHKLSEGAGGRNRCVHVVLPWPGVRECLTGGFLRAVSHESFVPVQTEQHTAPRD